MCGLKLYGEERAFKKAGFRRFFGAFSDNEADFFYPLYIVTSNLSDISPARELGIQVITLGEFIRIIPPI